MVQSCVPPESSVDRRPVRMARINIWIICLLGVVLPGNANDQQPGCTVCAKTAKTEDCKDAHHSSYAIGKGLCDSIVKDDILRDNLCMTYKQGFQIHCVESGTYAEHNCKRGCPAPPQKGRYGSGGGSSLHTRVVNITVFLLTSTVSVLLRL
ncbi:uncharacterized protein LOC124135684 [Haliotis rufescens]|uniref:uncharacterized protein LOC124135684 n=1 Tax=Haliotis rufescens TaxID=6454 RepID=UPI001EAFE10D|nr:uncharacterized protein LOC124135684 [Haliotis rufescens]